MSVIESIYRDALKAVSPSALLSPASRDVDTAYLFLGKAAAATERALGPRTRAPVLVIGPAGESSRFRFVAGEHPLPGPGSFRAGAALLDFVDAVGRSGCPRLEIHLSGGASSMAWVKPAGMSEEELHACLRALYARPLPIADLNRERAKLCALKGGGAARWLKLLAPRTKARVQVISDVLPNGPEVVGSGPFWDGHIPHRVLADNRTLARAARASATRHGLKTWAMSAGNSGTWQTWTETIAAQVEKYAGRSGVILYGGEPSVALPLSRVGSRARGGRQTQIAAALALRFEKQIRAGRLELLCGSSDGHDGNSGGAGARIDRAALSRLRRSGAGEDARKILRASVREFSTANALSIAGALLREELTGTNVQDLVAVRLHGPALI